MVRRRPSSAMRSIRATRTGRGTAPRRLSADARRHRVGETKALHPAATAACTPCIESSITRHDGGSTPAAAAAARNRSGAGLAAAATGNHVVRAVQSTSHEVRETRCARTWPPSPDATSWRQCAMAIPAQSSPPGRRRRRHRLHLVGQGSAQLGHKRGIQSAASGWSSRASISGPCRRTTCRETAGRILPA